MNTQLKADKDLELTPGSVPQPKVTSLSLGSRLDTLWKAFTGVEPLRGRKPIAPKTNNTHHLSIIIHRLTAVDPWDQCFDHETDFCVWLTINDALGGVVGVSSDGDPPHWQSNQIMIKNPLPGRQVPIAISIIRTDDSSDANSVDIAETQRIELSYNLETGMIMGSGVIGRQGRPIFHVSPFNLDDPFNRLGVWFSVRHQSE